MPAAAGGAAERGQRTVWIRPWLSVLSCPIGHRIPVILLDADLEQNDARGREITHRLYGGDDAYRLKQGIALGIGGEQLLRALGFRIPTYHLNEGHAALLALALLRERPRSVSALSARARGKLRSVVKATPRGAA